MSIASKIAGFDWHLDRQADGELVLRLATPAGKVAAIVSLRGYRGLFLWHVWDENGVRGECSNESSVEQAMLEAEKDTARWGRH